jgi:hypothetical protein
MDSLVTRTRSLNVSHKRVLSTAFRMGGLPILPIGIGSDCSELQHVLGVGLQPPRLQPPSFGKFETLVQHVPVPPSTSTELTLARESTGSSVAAWRLASSQKFGVIPIDTKDRIKNQSYLLTQASNYCRRLSLFGWSALGRKEFCPFHRFTRALCAGWLLALLPHLSQLLYWQGKPRKGARRAFMILILGL